MTIAVDLGRKATKKTNHWLFENYIQLVQGWDQSNVTGYCLPLLLAQVQNLCPNNIVKISFIQSPWDQSFLPNYQKFNLFCLI